MLGIMIHVNVNIQPEIESEMWIGCSRVPGHVGVQGYSPGDTYTRNSSTSHPGLDNGKTMLAGVHQVSIKRQYC